MAREKTKLVLGRGEVYFDRFATGTLVGDGERYIGNTPSFQITREVTRQASMSAYNGRKHVRKGFVTAENIEMQMTVDHISSENLDLWFSSEKASVSIGDQFLPLSETIVVKKGRWFQLGSRMTPGGIRYVDTLTLTVNGAALVSGIDYQFDKTLGRFEILVSSTLADGAIASASYMKRPSAVTTTQSQSVDVMGALRYISHNATGPRLDYWFPQVKLSPRGSVEMKSDEFMQMQFDVTAVRLGASYALAYMSHAGSPPGAITADTALITADTTNYTADNGLWTETEMSQ